MCVEEKQVQELTQKYLIMIKKLWSSSELCKAQKEKKVAAIKDGQSIKLKITI